MSIDLTPAQRIRSQYVGLIRCFLSALEYDATLQPIRDKVSLSGGKDRLFSQMADESYPTPNEREIIRAWGEKRQHCANINQVNDEGFNAAQMLILELYKGGVTYGQFTSQVQDLVKNISEQHRQQQAQQQNQQQQQRQFCETRYQQCLNRAFDVYARNACQMELGGCQIAGALNR